MRNDYPEPIYSLTNENIVYTSSEGKKRRKTISGICGVLAFLMLTANVFTPIALAQAADEADGAFSDFLRVVVEKTMSLQPEQQQDEVVVEEDIDTAETTGTDAQQSVEASKNSTAYQPESHHEDNKKLQQRLMDLYYMDKDEPTDYYGQATQQAVRYFQRKHGLNVDGVAGPETIDILFSDSAKVYTVTVDTDGPDVEGIQARLKDLGYPVEATGYFGSDTEYAVRYFQRMNGLEDDGSVGEYTKELLYSKSAEPSLEYYQQQEDTEGSEDTLESSGWASNNSGTDNGSTGSGSSGSSSSGSGSSSSNGGQSTPKPSVQPEQPSASPAEEQTPSPSPEEGGDSATVPEAEQQDDPEVADLGEPEDSGDADSTEDTSASEQPSEQPGNKLDTSEEPEIVPISEPEKNDDDSNVAAANPGSVESFISAGLAQLGKRYVRGGKGPNSFDCSGFVYYALNQSGNKIGYMTSAGWAKSGYKTISKMADLQRGDVICFSGHVAIYLGGNEMVDASSSNGKVVRRSMGDWCRRNFICGKRPL